MFKQTLEVICYNLSGVDDGWNWAEAVQCLAFILIMLNYNNIILV
jgi:hypothetical protein